MEQFIKRKYKRRIMIVLSGLGVFSFWFFLGEIGVRIFAYDSYTMVPPSEILKKYFYGLQGGFLVPLLISGKRIVLGYGLALLIGSIIGSIVVINRCTERFLNFAILGVQSLPSICWLPVAVLWFGLNESSIIFVVFMGSIGSIIISTRDGLRTIPIIYKRIGDTFGVNLWQRLVMIYFPAALPTYLSGMKQAWSFAWRSLMAGELLYHSKSIGSLLHDSRDLADYQSMYAVMLLIITISLSINKLIFTPIEKIIRTRWGL